MARTSEPIHKDHFGRILKVGDTVAYTQAGYRALARGMIDKLNAKTVRVIGSQGPNWPSHCHPGDVVLSPAQEHDRQPKGTPPPGAGERL